MPGVGAGFECQHRRGVRRLRVIFQVLIQKRLQHRLAEPQSRVLTELQCAEHTAVAVTAAVAPGSDDEEVAIVTGIFRLGGCVDRRGSIDVFLVPLPVNVQSGYEERAAGEDAIYSLLLPVTVVCGMLGQPLPEWQLVSS